MTPKRNYRDSLFRSYFNNKRLLLELANLLEGTHYTNPKAIRITTLRGTFFNDLKNDISFQLENHFLVLFEHQSTVNENMPLRCLFYLSKLLQKRIEQRDLYKEELLKIPAPRFYVFYNGSKALPDKQELHLSDSFADTARNYMELTVKLYNINYSEQNQLLQRCRALRDYSLFINLVQQNASHGLPLDQAINQAIDYCIHHDVMKDFLTERSKEVYDMVSFKWDADMAKEVWQEEAMQKGLEKGVEKGVEKTALEMLRDKVDMNSIAKYTKLSLEKLNELGRLHGLL